MVNRRMRVRSAPKRALIGPLVMLGSGMVAGVLRELRIPKSRVNVHGGAIALGHPIGASGARVLVTLLHAMAERDARLGVASLCIGGGQGIALVAERA